MRSLFLSLGLLAVLPALAPAADEPKFFFQPGDRVLFLGDSITEQYQYSTYIELYLTTRFPKANYTFLNAGIGGDTANGGANRFKSQVLEEKPTAITINFGMNDGGYGKFDKKKNDQYVEKSEAMLKMAKDAGIRVALCSPNAVDVRVNKGFAVYLETQKEFYAPLKEIAAKNGAAYADQYGVTRSAIEAMTKDDPEAKKAKPYYDGFHTSPPGGLLMAHAILTQLRAPALVSNAAIDAKGASKTALCKIEDLKASDTGATFTRTDEAIPMPIQKDWLPMLPYTNALKDLNDYGLSLAGLKEGNYDVTVDGVKLATFTAKELADGVNLGNFTSGPLYDAGKKVFDAIQAKNSLVGNRFFSVHRANLPGWLKVADLQEQKQKELDRITALIRTAEKKIVEVSEPKAYKFGITAAK